MTSVGFKSAAALAFKYLKLFIIIYIGPSARSNWSKSHVLAYYKNVEKACFFATIPLYHKANEEA